MNKKRLRYKAIQRMNNIIKGKRYIVAYAGNGYILYNQKDYDKVIEVLGFIAPITVAKFHSYSNADRYLHKMSGTLSILDSINNDEWDLYPWSDPIWD